MTPEDLGFSSARLERIGAVGRRYVDAGKIPCSAVQVARRGEVVYRDHYGMADVANSIPVAEDTIYRIYSMTKPLTSIALMQLYEEGELLLEDPVERFLPAFANMTVWAGGSDQAPIVNPATRKMTIRDILTHTSGLTYGFMRQHPLDARYRENKLGDFVTAPYSLTEAVELLGEQPLLFEPGTSWNYSMSTDVCGAVVEAVTGQTLDVALAERVIHPLNMVDTGFWVREGEAARFTSLYVRGADGQISEIDAAATSAYHHPPQMLSGGGGLVSTMGDYQRFCSMLAAGGELDGARVIGRKTLDYMCQNHLPGGALLNQLGQSLFSEVSMEGMGFGLGFSVIEDPAANGAISSKGEFAWGGAASTAFWIDPEEDLTVIFLTQLLPSSTYPLRRQLRAAVYGALI